MYPARVRSNRKEPTIGFRCSSQAMKENIQKLADAEGKSVNAFLRDLVENHVARVLDTPNTGASQ